MSICRTFMCNLNDRQADTLSFDDEGKRKKNFWEGRKPLSDLHGWTGRD